MTEQDDPLKAAEVYAAYGRTAQAREVLLDAAKKDPAKAAIYKQRAAELERHAKTPAAREQQIQRFLLVGLVGFAMFVAGDVMNWPWLRGIGVVVWVGFGLVAAFHHIRRLP